jgi:ribosome biogenesis GTPase A
MSIDMTKRLHATEVDSDELAKNVLSFFGRGSNKGTRKPRYFKEKSEDSYIEFAYDKRGNLLRITAQPTVSKADLKAIQEMVKQKLIDKQVEKIGQSVAFSFPPINGYFRHSDLFQVNPSLELPPDTHPLQYPFVLTVQVYMLR